VIKFVDFDKDQSILKSLEIGAFRGSVINMPNDLYHACKKYHSSSDLKFLYASSPAHYYAKYYAKFPEIQNTTDKMILGSLVHCLILEPHRYEKDFFVMPDLNFRTNEGKARKQELIANNPGKMMIDGEMLVQANNMKSSVMNNPQAKTLLDAGQKEAAYFWECPFTNLPFRAKLDQSSKTHFVELKTTSDAGPEEFSKHIHNMNYDLSLVHYREGLKQVKEVEPPAYFIVVEQDPPHVAQVYKAGESVFQTGHDKWLSSITQLEAGIKKKQWPGYFPTDLEAPEIQMPAFAINKLIKSEGF
jgi:PDDEXK-like domain of unknown function (DUF3799)